MCKDQTLRDIQTCLEGVVGKNSGTGKLAYSKYFRVAGKTGTAQIWSKHGFAANYLVSFAGYFPADRPKYSMIVCIEKTAPAYGGMHCCPVFKKIAETVMARDLNADYRARATVQPSGMNYPSWQPATSTHLIMYSVPSVSENRDCRLPPRALCGEATLARTDKCASPKKPPCRVCPRSSATDCAMPSIG